MQQLPNELILNISSFLTWEHNELIWFEQVSKRIYMCARSARYARLPGKYLVKCVKTCDSEKCYYPIYRFGTSIDSIVIDIETLYPLLFDMDVLDTEELERQLVTYKGWKNVIDKNMFNTFISLPIWKIVKQLNIVGFREELLPLNDMPMLDFLMNKNVTFANLQQLQLPGYYEISNAHLMEKFPQIRGFSGHIWFDNDEIVEYFPDKLQSIHGSIQSINSLFNAFKIHKQIKEICLFYDVIRYDPDHYNPDINEFNDYAALINLERIKLTDRICNNSNMHLVRSQLELLLKKICALNKLKYMDIYIHRGNVNYLTMLTGIIKGSWSELIIRYNYAHHLNLNDDEFVSNLIAFIDVMGEMVKQWMIIIRWKENAKFHRGLISLSKMINISYSFNKYEPIVGKFDVEYSLTRSNMKHRIMRYSKTKWIMDCNHCAEVECENIRFLWP